MRKFSDGIKIKPLLGALHIYGKDRRGYNIILPTNYQPMVERLTMIQWLKQRLITMTSKTRHKNKYVPFTAVFANHETKEYMRRVFITLNQYKYVGGKWEHGTYIGGSFIKEIHPEAITN